MITTKQELITPMIAQEYLARNIENRRLNKPTVRAYAKLMQDGLWGLSNDAISFAEDGTLINGQHRLSAVCQSGVSCEFVVIRGLSRDAFSYIDNGRTRQASDTLYIDNVESSTRAASIIKRKLQLDGGKSTLTSRGGNTNIGASTKIHNVMVVDEFYKHADAYKIIGRSAESLYTQSRLLSASEYGGFLAHLSLTLNHPFETVFSFFKEFAEIDRPTNDVVVLLRQKLIKDKLSPTLRMTGFVKQKIIIKAWNAWITGKTVKQLKYIESTDKDLWFI